MTWWKINADKNKKKIKVIPTENAKAIFKTMEDLKDIPIPTKEEVRERIAKVCIILPLTLGNANKDGILDVKDSTRQRTFPSAYLGMPERYIPQYYYKLKTSTDQFFPSLIYGIVPIFSYQVPIEELKKYKMVIFAGNMNGSPTIIEKGFLKKLIEYSKCGNLFITSISYLRSKDGNLLPETKKLIGADFSSMKEIEWETPYTKQIPSTYLSLNWTSVTIDFKSKPVLLEPSALGKAQVIIRTEDGDPVVLLYTNEDKRNVWISLIKNSLDMQHLYQLYYRFWERIFPYYCDTYYKKFGIPPLQNEIYLSLIPEKDPDYIIAFSTDASREEKWKLHPEIRMRLKNKGIWLNVPYWSRKNEIIFKPIIDKDYTAIWKKVTSKKLDILSTNLPIISFEEGRDFIKLCFSGREDTLNLNLKTKTQARNVIINKRIAKKDKEFCFEDKTIKINTVISASKYEIIIKF